MSAYPVAGPRPFVECPVHGCAVSTDAEGRINASCPHCDREASNHLTGFDKKRGQRVASGPVMQTTRIVP